MAMGIELNSNIKNGKNPFSIKLDFIFHSF